MASEIKPGEELFLDTSFAIALSVSTDQHHHKSLNLVVEMERAATQLVTTRAVLLEIGNALRSGRLRVAAAALLQSLEMDERTTILPLDEELYRLGASLFASRSDKSWSLTDCISFVVMRERKVYRALTADHHFQQAGFSSLLLE